MLIKYNILMFLSLMVFIFFVDASERVKPDQNEASQSKNVNQAQFAEMLKKYQAHLYIQGQMKQEKWIKELGITLKSEGVFEVSQFEKKSHLVDWHILKPESLHICIEGQKIYIKDSQQTKPIEQDLALMSGQGQDSMKTIKALMGSDVGYLFNEFPSVTTARKTLTLKNEKLTVDLKMNESQLIKEIQLSESNGDVLKIEFLNLKSNLKNNKLVPPAKKCSERL